MESKDGALSGAETAAIDVKTVSPVPSTRASSARSGIEVDDGYTTDGAESIFDSNESYTTSITTSVVDYEFENGRRYHAYKSGRYMLPNDQSEMDREDMKHHMTMLLTSGQLTLAPIGDNPQRILDIGTGTGSWAVETADEYPSAEVIATDLSAIQSVWVPPNLKFEIDDAEAEWMYNPESFDLVHIRYMIHGIRNWPKLLGQAKTALRPGGYVELVELCFIPYSHDDSIPPPEESHFYKFYDLISQAAAKVGLNMDIATTFSDMLKDAGYEDVTEKVYDLPMGPWPKDPRLKEVGAFQLAQFLSGLQGIAMGLLTRVLGWTREQVEVMLIDLRKELTEKGRHMYWKTYFVHGRKPIKAEASSGHVPLTTEITPPIEPTMPESVPAPAVASPHVEQSVQEPMPDAPAIETTPATESVQEPVQEPTAHPETSVAAPAVAEESAVEQPSSESPPERAQKRARVDSPPTLRTPDVEHTQAEIEDPMLFSPVNATNPHRD